MRSFWLSMFITGLMLSACMQPTEISGPHFRSVVMLDSADVLSIHNSGGHELCLVLRVGDIPVCDSELIDRIRNLPDEFPGEGIERKAWRYVMINADYLPSYSEDRDAHGPLVFFNSIGRGQCDDLAALLAHIWRALGFEARVRTLEGHVVPEVQIGGKWQMYDPSFQVYYLTRDGQVAGAEKLSREPDLITEPVERIPPHTYNNMDGSVLDSLRYSPFMAAYYSNGGRNEVSQWYDEAMQPGEMRVCIPSGATLDLPHREVGMISMRGWHGDLSDSTPLIRLTFGKPGTQRVRMPYALVATTGEAAIVKHVTDPLSGGPLFIVDTVLWVDAIRGDGLYYLMNGRVRGRGGVQVTVCTQDTSVTEIRAERAGGASLRQVWQNPVPGMQDSGCCHPASPH